MIPASVLGLLTATPHALLSDWTAGTERSVYVVLEFKRAGTEGDTGTSIDEQSVTFTQGEVEHASTSRARFRLHPFK